MCLINSKITKHELFNSRKKRLNKIIFFFASECSGQVNNGNNKVKQVFKKKKKKPFKECSTNSYFNLVSCFKNALLDI